MLRLDNMKDMYLLHNNGFHIKQRPIKKVKNICTGNVL